MERRNGPSALVALTAASLSPPSAFFTWPTTSTTRSCATSSASGVFGESTLLASTTAAITITSGFIGPRLRLGTWGLRLGQELCDSRFQSPDPFAASRLCPRALSILRRSPTIRRQGWVKRLLRLLNDWIYAI